MTIKTKLQTLLSYLNIFLPEAKDTLSDAVAEVGSINQGIHVGGNILINPSIYIATTASVDNIEVASSLVITEENA